MTHDIRDALIDALRPVCANPEVAADVCLGVMEKWGAAEPDQVVVARRDWFDKSLVTTPGTMAAAVLNYVTLTSQGSQK